ncbi:MAG: 50S ribosomal protein L6 [Malacoplasma sp.]|nr:50S ribosomal protein L6 [Malacoplasma sp.]
MSRVGNRLLSIPSGVNVEIEKFLVKVSGKLGTLAIPFDNKKLSVLNKDSMIIVKRANDEKQTKMLHGTTNANIKNALVGVSEGHTKKLKVTGVGYRAAVSGSKITLSLGYSHPVILDIPQGLTITCPQVTEIVITGADKAVVGQFAAVIRSKRPPEPYKGKGVAYADEVIVRKVGKTAEGSKK